MNPFSCIIVDDDEIDRLMVVSFVKRFPNLQLLATFGSSSEALRFLESHPVTVLFLDIDMPGLSGLELRQKTSTVPVCIFITAHPEHAVESFELDTLDFIIKPLKFERFAKTMDRISAFMELKTKASFFESSIGGDTIYIKEGHEQTKIKLHEILYLEALKDYTLLVTPQKRHCVLSSIGNLLKEDHFQSFIRIHRSFAIQKHFVQKIGANEIVLNNNMSLPVGRSYKEQIGFL
tara:strand:+ start:749 stop:1450 length:702 start_codon:yes stop_codon:yes gene_type:complete